MKTEAGLSKGNGLRKGTLLSLGPLNFEAVIGAVLDQIIEAVRKVIREELSTSAPSAGEWLGREDVAQLLGYKPSYISELVRRRDLPCHRVGRKMRFRLSEVEAWLRGDS